MILSIKHIVLCYTSLEKVEITFQQIFLVAILESGTQITIVQSGHQLNFIFADLPNLHGSDLNQVKKFFTDS